MSKPTDNMTIEDLEDIGKRATRMATLAPNEPATRAWLRLADAAWALWCAGNTEARIWPVT